jgi:hypothetical protein
VSNNKTTGAALLARIKPQLARKNAYLCLRPDLIQSFEELNEQLAQSMADDAAAVTDGRLTSKERHSKKTKDLAAKVKEIEGKIEANEAVFRFEALPKDEWAALTAQHGPRKGDQFDMLAGYNREAVLDLAIRSCMYDPEFEDCPTVVEGSDEFGEECNHQAGSICDGGSWQSFLAICNQSEWNELREVVQAVNSAHIDAPKSPLASRVLLSSGASSEPRTRSASRSAGSRDGSRAKSTSTSG